MSGLAILDKGTKADTLSAIRQAQEYVRTADAPDAADIAERARVAREWVRVARAAREIAVEAIRLECLAFRRLGALGEQGRLNNLQARAAEHFGAMSDEDFQVDVLDTIGRHASALAIFQRISREERDEGDRRDGRRIANGSTVSPIEVQFSLRTLASAASSLLDHLREQDVTTTVSAAAKALAEETDFGYDWGRSPAIREGFREVIRTAIRHEPIDEAATPAGAPRWVTYEEDDIGWVRIPWHLASLGQFRVMVELRRRQADEMESAARGLERLLADLEAAKQRNPHKDSCDELGRSVAISMGRKAS